MRSTVLSAALIAVLCGSMTACGGDGPETVQLGGHGSTTKPNTVERPWGTVATFPELSKAQTPTADDIAFATDMITHHAQAIELSENLLAHDGADERVTAAANFIKQDQTSEITTMTAWLDAWDSSVPEHHGGHHSSGATMPGMLSEADVDDVQKLATQHAQVEFLRLMTIHHAGAIDMSQEYLEAGKNTFTRSTAQHIIREQQVEINYFGHTIDDLCATGPVPSCPRS